MYRLRNIGLFRSRRTRRQDEIALSIAERRGMKDVYLAARPYTRTPLEALEDYDMVTAEERKLFEE